MMVEDGYTMFSHKKGKKKEERNEEARAARKSVASPCTYRLPPQNMLGIVKRRNTTEATLSGGQEQTQCDICVYGRQMRCTYSLVKPQTQYSLKINVLFICFSAQQKAR